MTWLRRYRRQRQRLRHPGQNFRHAHDLQQPWYATGMIVIAVANHQTIHVG